MKSAFNIAPKWDELLSPEMEKKYFINLMSFLSEEYVKDHVTPKKENIFKAFRFTDFQEVKVVIIGSGPYHEKGIANGLAFGTDGLKVPKALINIYKELSTVLWLEGKFNNALDAAMSLEGTSLEGWAKQGVLLLNSRLTVEIGKPSSHGDIGWDRFMNRVIRYLLEREDKIVFLLWGSEAQDLANAAGIQNQQHHIVLKCSHPAPSVARPKDPFNKSRHFHLSNKFLSEFGSSLIDWTKIT